MVAVVLRKAGRRLRSVALEADGTHLMTDVWTSVGVIGGLLAVMWTNWLWLDASIAILVALHILFEGARLMHEAVNGLMDKSLKPEEIACVQALLDSYSKLSVSYRELRTRQAGTERFVSVSILVPGDWTVERAHDLLDEIEARVAEQLPGSHVDTHLEPTYCVVPSAPSPK